MAMDENAMADAILAELGGDTTSEQGLARKASFAKFCRGLITHIRAAAEINGTAGVGLVAPSGGGPVTGGVILPPGSIT